MSNCMKVQNSVSEANHQSETVLQCCSYNSKQCCLTRVDMAFPCHFLSSLACSSRCLPKPPGWAPETSHGGASHGSSASLEGSGFPWLFPSQNISKLCVAMCLIHTPIMLRPRPAGSQKFATQPSGHVWSYSHSFIITEEHILLSHQRKPIGWPSCLCHQRIHHLLHFLLMGHQLPLAVMFLWWLGSETNDQPHLSLKNGPLTAIFTCYKWAFTQNQTHFGLPFSWQSLSQMSRFQPLGTDCFNPPEDSRVGPTVGLSLSPSSLGV